MHSTTSRSGLLVSLHVAAMLLILVLLVLPLLPLLLFSSSLHVGISRSEAFILAFGPPESSTLNFVLDVLCLQSPFSILMLLAPATAPVSLGHDFISPEVSAFDRWTAVFPSEVPSLQHVFDCLAAI